MKKESKKEMEKKHEKKEKMHEKKKKKQWSEMAGKVYYRPFDNLCIGINQFYALCNILYQFMFPHIETFAK